MALAADQFERYYAEKLWEIVPPIYRQQDGLADNPGVLRAIVQIVARQAAVLRRSQDRLWDDQFIELCDEWAVPYIGNLVATRLLSDLNKRGRRIDVAKTIYYRRRKGTLRILEELVSDITGWDGKLVEQFQKLTRTRHGLDPFPQLLAGRFSGTPPGGTADLRNPRIAELANGPFEEYFHTYDVRKQNGLDGRYAIPKLAFYLYRLKAFAIENVTPHALGDGLSFTFDPSGRDISLFSQRLRPDDWDEWYSALEWELPAPIPCRLLGDTAYKITETVVRKLLDPANAFHIDNAAAAELRKLSGYRFKSEESLVAMLKSFVNSAQVLQADLFKLMLSVAMVADCGKSVLLPDDDYATNPLETSSIMVGFNFDTVNLKIITTENINAGDLSLWTTTPPKQLAIDAVHGRFKFNVASVTNDRLFASYHYGFSGSIGAGTYNKRTVDNTIPNVLLTGGGYFDISTFPDSGIVQITDSATYNPVSNKNQIQNLTIRAANIQRPYISLQDDLILDTGGNVDVILVLDGLWLGNSTAVAKSVILRGNYKSVCITNCTIDPGGVKNLENDQLLPLNLMIDGFVETLKISASIVGPIMPGTNGDFEKLIICDSIVQSTQATVNAIDLNKGAATIKRTTVFGQSMIHRLEATEMLATDIITVVDTQNGCFRFGAAPTSSRLPKPYESTLFIEDTGHWFVSRRFGDAGFAQLSDTAPASVATGAENGSEIGAFSSLLNPIKMAGLRAKINEFMPFGLIPVFINIT